MKYIMLTLHLFISDKQKMYDTEKQDICRTALVT